jgi:hypothetical protein
MVSEPMRLTALPGAIETRPRTVRAPTVIAPVARVASDSMAAAPTDSGPTAEGPASKWAAPRPVKTLEPATGAKKTALLSALMRNSVPGPLLTGL